MNDTTTARSGDDRLKDAAAAAAIELVPDDGVIGVGTGSTTNFFIDRLADIRHLIRGAVPSSVATQERLQQHGIEILDLNSAGTLELYVDGADECNPQRQLIKGGGGALTREKIVAAASRRFVCIVHESKCVPVLGAFPLPVEVIPLARSYVARELVKLGGDPELREAPRTDNGNQILDVWNLQIDNPDALEQSINQIAGVVTVGLFAARPADTVLIAQHDGEIRTL